MSDSQFFPIVQDVMTKSVYTITPDLTVRQAKEMMRDKGISGMPVTDQENTLIGIISVADIIQAMETDKLDLLIPKVMSAPPVFLREHDTIRQALQVCREYKCGRFPVIDENAKVVGIITAGDILARLALFLRIDELEKPDEKKAGQSFPAQVYDYKINSMNFDLAGVAASDIKKKLIELGIDGVIVRRAAIAAYEAEMNVVIHANSGKLLARVTPKEILFTVIDNGPGIKDVDLAMQKGYSTASDEIREMGFGAGMGLPNIKKSADEFNLASSPQGTILEIKIFIP